MRVRDEFRITYNPLPTATRVAELSARLKGTIIRSVIGAAIWTGLFFWQRHNLASFSITFLVLGYVVSVVLIGVLVGRLWQARRSLRHIGAGDAVVIDRRGIAVFPPQGASVATEWPQISGVFGKQKFGRAPELVVQRADRSLGGAVPLATLDAHPGTIDNAVRVFSGGRLGLNIDDLSL